MARKWCWRNVISAQCSEWWVNNPPETPDPGPMAVDNEEPIIAATSSSEDDVVDETTLWLIKEISRMEVDAEIERA